MANIKTPEEIKSLRENGKKLAHILEELIEMSKPGVTTQEIDTAAEQKIKEAGGIPSFKNFRDRVEDTPFPSTICASVNNELVHTPASNRELKDGDIFTIDIGMWYPAEGHKLCTDMARTTAVGQISDEAQKLLDVTKKSLDKGIDQIKPGNTTVDIGRAVQEYVEAQGFSVVRRLVGHGVGHEVHEEPRIPNFVDPKHPKVKLEEGMVIAVEPMVNVGDYDITTLDDGWTIATADGSLSAHFEHTIAVTKEGHLVITAL